MTRLRRILVGGAAAILSYQLILPPVVTLADNGDFPRVIGRFDLWAAVHRTYIFGDLTYHFDPAQHWASEFYSSEIPLAGAAVALNSVVSKDGNFDIRAIGVVHGALFLLALWLLAPLLAEAPRRLQIAACALLLLFYCDEMYAAGLNSFYMDEPAYLFLALTIVFYLRAMRWGRRADAAGLLASAVLMAGAKSQHALIAFAVSLAIFLHRDLLWRKRARWTAAAALLPALTAVFMMVKGIPPGYTEFSVYNVAFEQILPHAKNVDHTLAELGLDASFKPFIGRNAYLPGSRMEEPAFLRDFSQRLNLRKLAVFYLLHPRDAWQTMVHALNEAGRQHAFGTFDVSAGYPAGAESRSFRWWSDFKARLFFAHGHRYFWGFAILTAIVAALVYASRRRLAPGMASAAFFLIAMSYAELATDSLVDSMDIVRHHLVFYALSDALVVVTIALAMSLPMRRPKEPPATGQAAPADTMGASSCEPWQLSGLASSARRSDSR